MGSIDGPCQKEEALRGLFVDDQGCHRSVAKVIFEELIEHTCRVDFAVNGTEAISRIIDTTYHFVITDFDMGRGPTGLNVAQTAVQYKVPTVIINTAMPYGVKNTDPRIQVVEKMRLERFIWVVESCRRVLLWEGKKLTPR